MKIVKFDCEGSVSYNPYNINIALHQCNEEKLEEGIAEFYYLFYKGVGEGGVKEFII